MHDTSQLGSRNFFFLGHNDQSYPLTTHMEHRISARTEKFQKYFIGGRYLGEALIIYPCSDVTKTLLMRLKVNPRWWIVRLFR